MTPTGTPYIPLSSIAIKGRESVQCEAMGNSGTQDLRPLRVLLTKADILIAALIARPLRHC